MTKNCDKSAPMQRTASGPVARSDSTPRMMQFIYRRGRPVAVVIGRRAAVSEHVGEREWPLVAAMCVYAIEVAVGQRPGPYRDEDAEQHAEAVVAATAGCSLRLRRRRPA